MWLPEGISVTFGGTPQMHVRLEWATDAFVSFHLFDCDGIFISKRSISLPMGNGLLIVSLILVDNHIVDIISSRKAFFCLFIL